MRLALCIATALAVLIAAPAAQSRVDRELHAAPATADADRPPRRDVGRCPDARRGLRFYSGRIRGWSETLGLPAMRFRQPAKCRYIKREASYRRLVARGLRHRYELIAGTAELAIRYVFGAHGSEAVAVARCESGLRTSAVNGQYLGLFQMGSYARGRYGHGSTALQQARYAFAYFVAAGRDWSPWSCKPWS